MRVAPSFLRRLRAPKIHLYAFCWNEELMIPFFLRHYEPLVDRMIIFDDTSTDRSVTLLRASPKVDLRPLPDDGMSHYLRHLAQFEQIWKESRGEADWVVTCDLDEHLHHPDLRTYLRQCRNDGVTAIHTKGYDMLTREFPAPTARLSGTVRRGVRSFTLDKTAIFDPNAIDEINYTPGRHLARPVGRVVYSPKREVKLLHYKDLGVEYLTTRTYELLARRTPDAVAAGWGLHNQRSPEEIRADFEQRLAAATEVVAQVS